MITLQQILKSQSDILNGARVKMVRHKDHRKEYRDVFKDREALLHYQKIQGKEVFKGCDYIISFIGLERGRSMMLGVFKVGACTKPDHNYFYELDPVPDFDELVDRLIIDWGNNAIAWHQWYDDKQAKEVVEIVPRGYMGEFPGLLQFVLEFNELRTLMDHPDANYEWYHHLSAVNGVYMILDTKTGQQYIGSAYGKEGIWQRWKSYSQSHTGGNKELKALIEQDPEYYRNFHFSILQTLPSNVTQDEIVKIEKLYKQKFGSRVHGLNWN